MPVLMDFARAPVQYEEVNGVLYPVTEETPVVQSNWHVSTVMAAHEMIWALLRDRPGETLFSDILLYWDEGDPKKRVAPDLVVFPEIACPEDLRRAIFLWNEASRPTFVLEVLSESTMVDDLTTKAAIYSDVLGVAEYFLCDPEAQPMQVWGYRLHEGAYEAIRRDERGRLWSAELRAWLGPDDYGMLQVWDESGAAMPRYETALRRAEEERRRLNEARSRAIEERRRAEAAEERIRALEEELRRRDSR